MLTVELRLQIWEYAIQHNRLLKIDIEVPSAASEVPTYSSTNALNKVKSGIEYTVTLKSFSCHNKLMQVNREARKVALRFYRVQFPCYIGATGGSREPIAQSTFYFNPEHDIIQVKAQLPLERTFIPLLHDLRALDPKDVGLLRLALDDELVTNLHHFGHGLEDPGRSSFVHSISYLQQIIWMANSSIGRGIMGPFSNLSNVGVRFIHSMPIITANSSFDVLTPDPRPIQSELRYVATANADPRNYSSLWHDTLKKWGIVQSHAVKEQVLFGFQPSIYGPQIHDVETARSYLLKEDESWLRGQQERSRLVLRHAGKIPVEGLEELAKAVKPAFGFWLFPIEALKEPEPSRIAGSPVFDLRGHEPKLALAHLYQ
jgi:hypothetical protein